MSMNHTSFFLFLHHIQPLHVEGISGLLQQEDITLLDLPVFQTFSGGMKM